MNTPVSPVRWSPARWFLPVHRRSRMWLLVAMCQTLVATALMSTLLIDERMQQALVLKAAEFIAADVRIKHPELNIQDLQALAGRHDLRFSHSQTLLTSVLTKEDDLHLASLKAVDGLYPLRGRLELAQTNSPTSSGAPASGQVWIDGFLASKGVSPGQRLRIGDLWLQVSAVIVREPDRPFAGPGTTARVMISHDDLGRSGLIRANSRMNSQVYLAGDRDKLEQFLDQAPLPDGARPEKAYDGGRADVRTVISNLSLFVSLAGFVAMLFAAIVLYLALQLLETEERRTQRLLRHWGYGYVQRSVWFWTRIGTVALVTNCLGALVALWAHDYISDRYLSQFFDELAPAQFSSLWQVALVSLAVLPVATLSLIDAVKNPWRNDTTRQYTMHALSWILLSVLIGVFFAGRINNIYLLAGLVLSVAGAVVLYLLFVRFVLNRLPSRGSFWSLLANNLRARTRLGMLQVGSLSLVIMIAMTVYLLREGMLASINQSLPADSPNHYLLSIQPDEIDVLSDELTAGLSLDQAPEFYPIVRARVIGHNGTDIDVESKDIIYRQRLSREWGLSYLNRSPNPIIAGQWFDSAPTVTDGAPDEAGNRPGWSVSTEVSDALGAKVGDKLTFRIGGDGEYTASIDSIRRVDWSNIKPNFFVLAAPGLLDEAPTTYITSLRVDESSRQSLNAIVAQFPGITNLDLNSIIDRIQELISIFVELMWVVLIYVTVLVLVVVGCIVQFGIETSRRESALFKSFGVPSSLLRRVRLCENFILSSLAVLPATALAVGASQYFYANVIQLPLLQGMFDDILMLSVVALLAVVTVTAAVGRLVTARSAMALLRGSADYHS
ncbi:MAG: hypothetical protein K0U66_10970 [Gammaproteobacteria bacterium]|nr:hypothetical protein [Gammaproteobacteria bacterium]